METNQSRRDVLLGTSILAGAATTSATAEEKAENAPSPLKIVVTGGHPGDPEYGCGGTIARYTDAGHEVTNLYLNRGEWRKNPETDPDPVPIRMAESEKACEILGAKPRFADQVDGQSIIDKEHYGSFKSILLDTNPDIVFTHWPIDNHADHRALAMLVYDAWHRTGHQFALYYYEVTTGHDTLQFHPTDYVDISAYINRKKKACYAHASQKPDKHFGIQETVTKMRGAEYSCEQAEAFIRMVQSPGETLPGVCGRE